MHAEVHAHYPGVGWFDTRCCPCRSGICGDSYVVSAADKELFFKQGWVAGCRVAQDPGCKHSHAPAFSLTCAAALVHALCRPAVCSFVHLPAVMTEDEMREHVDPVRMEGNDGQCVFA